MFDGCGEIDFTMQSHGEQTLLDSARFSCRSLFEVALIISPLTSFVKTRSKHSFLWSVDFERKEEISRASF